MQLKSKGLIIYLFSCCPGRKWFRYYAWFFALAFMGCTNNLFAKNKIAGYTEKLKDSTTNGFIQVVLSKNKVYVGETVIIKYFLCSLIPIMDPQNETDFEFKNCYMEAYPDNIQTEDKLINNKIYHVTLIKKLLLIPQNNGPLNIPSISKSFKITIPADKDDFWEKEKIVVIKFSSVAKVIDVLPLPPQNDTIQFSGAVGKFTINSNFVVSKKMANTISFHLEMNGIGNMKFPNLIAPQLPKGVEIYNENNKETHELLEDGLSLKRIFSFDLVTNYRGTYTIPPIAVLFFDPSTLKYEKYITKPYKWDVEKGSPLPKWVAKVNSKPVNKLIDVLYTKLNFADTNTGKLFINTVLYYFILILSVLLILTGLAYKFIMRAKHLDPFAYNYRSARKQALKNIKKLRSRNFLKDQDSFSKDLIFILKNYLCHKNYLLFDDLYLPDTHILFQNNSMPDGVKKQVSEFVKEQYNFRFSFNDQIELNKEKSCLALSEIIKNLEVVYKKTYSN
jgi:hypothetical protein